jgi:glycerol-3-phosphate dehydrogenase (NAD(P)+)
MSTVSVLGDGAWGTALSLILLKNGHEVTLWSAFADYAEVLRRERENVTFLPGTPLPDALGITSEVGEALEAGILVMAVPTKFMREVLGSFTTGFRAGGLVVSVAKGIEHETTMRPTEIVRELLPGSVSGVLSGPSHAEEVVRLLPAAVVAAAEEAETAERIQQLFAGESFRVYTSTDVLGVELGGAFKNVIAIAAGMCDGLDLGDNAKSALMTRGLEEMRRLGGAMGADRATFFGLSGIGDLITTCSSPYGRNRAVGMRLGRGEKLDDIVSSTEAVAEGVLTTRSVCELADRHGVEVPISREVYKVIFEDKEPKAAARELMTRLPKPEF